jgi:hypothetical protein
MASGGSHGNDQVIVGTLGRLPESTAVAAVARSSIQRVASEEHATGTPRPRAPILLEVQALAVAVAA